MTVMVQALRTAPDDSHAAAIMKKIRKQTGFLRLKIQELRVGEAKRLSQHAQTLSMLDEVYQAIGEVADEAGSYQQISCSSQTG